jgi:squalene synthase HpnC
MHPSTLHIAHRPWTLKDSVRYCEQLTSSHYENFPVASRLLPKDRRSHVCTIYAFARIADDFADEPGYTPAERVDNLNTWEEQLADCYEGRATHPVFIALAETADRFQIPIELFQNLLTAFRSDVTTSRYASFDDLLAYCENSANPIGRLVLLLFNYRSESLFQRSDALCTALQLTNFWQDIRVDNAKNRIYLPQDDLSRFGLTEDDILHERFGRRFQNLMAFQVARTEGLFAEGHPLLAAVGKDLRLELRLTWHGGMRILQKIRHSNFDVFAHRPTLSLYDKAALVAAALRG